MHTSIHKCNFFHSFLEHIHSKSFSFFLEHVADFCDKYGCLGPYSTQSMESAHSNFKTTWANYSVDEITNPTLFAKKLLQAVIKYNSKHVQNSCTK